MPPKPYSLMGIFLIMGIAGCISSTVSAAMRPEDLDAQLADLRAPLHHFRDKLNPQANALALALSLSLFLSEGLKQGQTPCPGASAPPQMCWEASLSLSRSLSLCLSLRLRLRPSLLLPSLRGELSPPGTMARPPFTGCQRRVNEDDSVDRKSRTIRMCSTM